jgi:hypothetical protein
MIRVTVEMVPFGDEARRRTLHTVEIANQIYPTQEQSLYTVRLDGRVWPTRVKHARSRGIWPLLRKACAVCRRFAEQPLTNRLGPQ